MKTLSEMINELMVSEQYVQEMLTLQDKHEQRFGEMVYMDDFIKQGLRLKYVSDVKRLYHRLITENKHTPNDSDSGA